MEGTMPSHLELLREAVRLAQENRRRGGRPFGAVLAIDGAIVATGVNEVVQSNDPTTHAEMEALRAASRRLGRPQLAGSVVYASGHPCPMCLAAMVGAGVAAVYYAIGREDAAAYGFSSAASYERLRLPLDPPPLPMTRLDAGVTAAQLYGGGEPSPARAGGQGGESLG
jgi:guanine deaminase